MKAEKAKKESEGRRIDATFIEDLRQEVGRLVNLDVKQALNVANRAYRAAKLLNEPISLASGLRAKAQAYWAAAKFSKALQLFDRAQQIYREQGQEVAAARIGRSKVDILMLMGRYADALQTGEAAREVFKRHDERILMAQLDTNVGNVYHRLDQYQNALEFYDRALDVFTEAGDPSAIAMVECNRANIFTYLNDFDIALSLYEKAGSLLKNGGMELKAAQIRYNIPYLHFRKGNYNEALKLLHDLKPVLAELGDPVTATLCDLDTLESYLELSLFEDAVELAGHVRAGFTKLKMGYELAKALAYGAVAKLQLGNYSRAETELKEAKAIFETEGNQTYSALMNVYLAEVHLRRGAYEEAIPPCREALEIFLSNKLPIKANYARLQLAKAKRRQGDTSAAGQLCVEALKAFDQYEPPWLAYQLYHLLGGIRREEKDDAQAHACYLKAIEAIERMRSHVQSDEFKSTFFRDKLQVYEDMITFCLERHNVEEAFAYVERAKSRALVDLLARNFNVRARRPADPEVHQNWKKLSEELNWYYSKLNQQGLKSDQSLTQLVNEVVARERKLAELLRTIQIEDEEYTSLQEVTWSTAAQLQLLLAEDEALVEYYLGDEGLKIFVIDNEQTHVACGQATRDQLGDLLRTLRLQLEKSFCDSEPINADFKTSCETVNDCLHRLYQELLAPISSYLEGKKKLVIIPFDLLHYAPFHALYDGAAYLVDRCEISYAPSAYVYRLCRNKQSQKTGDILIIGIPDEFTPYIGEEVKAVKELFSEAKVLLGSEATKEAFIENAPSSRLIHLASHGTFRYDNPMFSALKLADSWLTFYDVFNLPLEAELVTLSGCHSGLSKVDYGDELLGLMRGFLYAGARSLVVSLWVVNDLHTAEFMKAFYSRIKEGYGNRAALRWAQIKIKERYPHPHIWAPFVLVGKS